MFLSKQFFKNFSLIKVNLGINMLFIYAFALAIIFFAMNFLLISSVGNPAIGCRTFIGVVLMTPKHVLIAEFWITSSLRRSLDSALWYIKKYHTIFGRMIDL